MKKKKITCGVTGIWWWWEVGLLRAYNLVNSLSLSQSFFFWFVPKRLSLLRTLSHDLGLRIREWQREEKRIMVADFSLSPVPTPCLLCLPSCLGFWFHRLSIFLLLYLCTHRLSLSLSWCTAKFNRLIFFLLIMRGF